MDKKTKILATLGPASNSLEMIEKLIDAGANMFRLNFSHGSHEYHQETLDNIRQAMQNKKKIVGILQDISGPKVRIGDVKEPFEAMMKMLDEPECIEDRWLDDEAKGEKWLLEFQELALTEEYREWIRNYIDKKYEERGLPYPTGADFD